jgi:hypothetical protein
LATSCPSRAVMTSPPTRICWPFKSTVLELPRSPASSAGLLADLLNQDTLLVFVQVHRRSDLGVEGRATIPRYALPDWGALSCGSVFSGA